MTTGEVGTEVLSTILCESVHGTSDADISNLLTFAEFSESFVSPRDLHLVGVSWLT